eukprot:CAMPEP_0205804118 /NCGR_PEP_ID=MMETSP0205-20121125/6915_1 /ASSEMBLY_ACC=CAM_ASM_000278 /TAXON_ID=36767 /ORGANISM="Euplotes focardii, Strain TN1" /LENGTH=80 /DNA_ID=CAMNT_0053073163 /DNA_START=418 /DNA_END=657 /DNA_ORIENTATION=-
MWATVFRFVYARREDTARIEKFRRTKDVDSDDEEDDAIEMNKYDLEEEESEEEVSSGHDINESSHHFGDEEEEEEEEARA